MPCNKTCECLEYVRKYLYFIIPLMNFNLMYLQYLLVLLLKYFGQRGIDRQRDGQMDGWMDRQMDGQIDGSMDRWMDRWICGWIDRWKDRWIDGCNDRQIDSDRLIRQIRQIHVHVYVCVYIYVYVYIYIYIHHIIYFVCII